MTCTRRDPDVRALDGHHYYDTIMFSRAMFNARHVTVNGWPGVACHWCGRVRLSVASA